MKQVGRLKIEKYYSRDYMISFYLATTIPKSTTVITLFSRIKAQFLISNDFQNGGEYLTIIPRGRMGSESIAHETEAG